jgi:hypothetical protein
MLSVQTVLSKGDETGHPDPVGSRELYFLTQPAGSSNINPDPGE